MHQIALFVHLRSIKNATPEQGQERVKGCISYDLDDRDGKVLVLRDLSFQSVPKAGADGIPVSYPVQVMAGELIDLSKVPTRQSLKEGSDYATNWTREEQKQLQKVEQDAYLKQFETETAVPR